MLENSILLPFIELQFLLLSDFLWQLQPFQQMATCLAMTPFWFQTCCRLGILARSQLFEQDLFHLNGRLSSFKDPPLCACTEGLKVKAQLGFVARVVW